MPEYIARISYGKDSLKMLDVIFTRNLPLDRITTTDVWATDNVSANLPPMEEFKARMDERIWNLYRVDVEHLCARNKDGSKKTYEQMFYHIPVRRSQTVQVERERETGSGPGWRVQGTITGFPPNTGYNYCQKLKLARDPHQGMATIQRETHVVPETQGSLGAGYKDFRQRLLRGAENSRSTMSRPLSTERPTRRQKRNIVEYIGIAADEPDRFGQLNDRKRAPLAEFGVEEDLCGLYCQYGRCLGPSYDTSCRDGCWFCHNQGVDSLRNLWRNWPDHWALLMKWDLDSPVTFKADGHTVHDFDKRFRMEDEQKIPTNRTFRWYMLDEPPKFVATEGEQLSLFERRIR